MDFDEGVDSERREPDPKQEKAEEDIVAYLEKNRSTVFFSRQLEVHFEKDWFHWITNRVLRDLVSRRVLKSEVRPLRTGGTVTLLWHKSHRYYRRDAGEVVKLVETYADPNIGAALGLQGEVMLLEGVAKRQFLLTGRDTRTHRGKTWPDTKHDLDFIFERDGEAYGTEVKNTLGYMDYKELEAKLRMCRYLGLRPLFVARMLPKPWAKEVIDAGGFALILKYQLYPWAHKALARTVKERFGLPVDAPRALAEGTIDRFVHWHEKL